MKLATCTSCDGVGEIKYEGGDDTNPTVKDCARCAGQGVVINPRNARLETQMLTELRDWRRLSSRNLRKRSLTITIEELDMLLAVADDLDALRLRLSSRA